MLMKRTRRSREKSEIHIQRKCPVWRVLCSVLLLLLAVLIGFPIWVAVTGVFMQQWELTEYLGPVLAGGNWDCFVDAVSARADASVGGGAFHSILHSSLSCSGIP